MALAQRDRIGDVGAALDVIDLIINPRDGLKQMTQAAPLLDFGSRFKGGLIVAIVARILDCLSLGLY
mgnify:CR=1 FL=1